jgi:hypothetical protein
MRKRVIRGAAGTVLGLLLLIQLVPYGHNHTNPSVRREPAWDSPQSRELAVRACYDCHSNQTDWPWYSNVAPISWLAQYDVDEGRRELNVSEWDRPRQEAGETARTVQRGQMPQWYYVLVHPEANLSPAERQALIQGLQATFGQRAEGGGGGESGRERR